MSEARPGRSSVLTHRKPSCVVNAQAEKPALGSTLKKRKLEFAKSSSFLRVLPTYYEENCFIYAGSFLFMKRVYFIKSS